ncbi:MAG: PAS domain S-box protein [Desulfovibrionaceae bacterium]|nr:PAS domain S-box protein [Desulfovibrionaceae bacterium]MBF0514947.1 PAS domain S-box protein [Desulfovibrionaceae bacterium]
MKPFYAWSIRTHLIFLVAVSVLPAMAIVLYNGSVLREASVRDAKDLCLRLVQSMATQQDRVVDTTRLMLKTLGKMPEIKAGREPDVTGILGSVLRENPNYALLVLAAPDGSVKTPTGPGATISVADRAYFQDVLRTRDFAVGEFVLSRIDNRAILPFACPVFNGGEISGVLVAALDLAAYGRIFSGIDLPESSVMALTDSRGVRLYRYPKSEDFAGKEDLPGMVELLRGPEDEGTFQGRGADGVNRLYAFKRLSARGSRADLLLRIGIPLDKAMAEAGQVVERNLAMLLAAALLALVSSWALGNLIIMRRLERLVDSAGRLERGELGARTGFSGEEGEFGQLGEAFDSMARSLENREREGLLAQAALRESEEKYRGIFENAVEGLFQSTMEGAFLNVNPALARMLGFDSTDELLAAVNDLGRQLYVDPLDREELLDILTKRGTVKGFETQFLRSDGSRVSVLVNARLVRGERGEIAYIEGSNLDISRRKQAEETVRRLNEELEARVAVRTYQLEVANNELKEILGRLRAAQHHLVQSEKMAALGGLVAGVAHEINTPVGVAVTAASHLEQKTRELLAVFGEGAVTRGGLAEYLAVCLESSGMVLSNLRRAADLIRGFKQVAVDQSSEVRRTFKFGEYVREVLLSLKPKLKKTRHEIEVRCEADLVVDSYPGALSQIVTNLVMNSLIHAYGEDDAGHLLLTAKAEDGNLEMTYSDDGRGIPKENLPHIFEPFFTTSRHKGGTGLGLHILYNIVTRTLGGRIACESEPGHGTVFTIVFPLTPESAPPAPEKA